MYTFIHKRNRKKIAILIIKSAIKAYNYFNMELAKGKKKYETRNRKWYKQFSRRGFYSMYTIMCTFVSITSIMQELQVQDGLSYIAGEHFFYPQYKYLPAYTQGKDEKTVKCILSNITRVYV